MWKQKAIETIKSKKLKLTPQRMKLIEVIAEIGEKHPTLTEILEKVREDFPTISFSTLYTNVLILKSLNLLDIFAVGDETRVELNLEPHINVFDENVHDLCDDELIKMIEERVRKRVRFVIAIVAR